MMEGGLTKTLSEMLPSSETEMTNTHKKPLYSSSHGRRICRRVPESVPTIGRRGLWSLAIGSGTARGSENSIQRSDLLVGPLQTRRILRYMSPEVPLPYPGHSPRSIRRFSVKEEANDDGDS